MDAFFGESNEMKVRVKVLFVILRLFLAFAVVGFAVQAASTQTKTVSNTISFVSTHVLATVTGIVTGAQEGSYINYYDTTTTPNDTERKLGTWNVGNNIMFLSNSTPIIITIAITNNSKERSLSFELYGYQYSAWNGRNLEGTNITRIVTYKVDDGEAATFQSYGSGQVRVLPRTTAFIKIDLSVYNASQSVSHFDNSFSLHLRNNGDHTVQPGELADEEKIIFNPSDGSISVPPNTVLEEEDLEGFEVDNNPAFYGVFKSQDYNIGDKITFPYFVQNGEVLYAKYGQVPTDISFTNTSDGLRVRNNGSNSAILEIPTSIDGVSITQIDGGAFSGRSNIVTLILPDNLKEIGGSAFSGTSLTSVTIPASVESIGGSAFSGAPIKQLKFQNGSDLTSLGNSVFRVSELENIDFGDNSELMHIEYGTFRNATKLTSVRFGENSKLTEIAGALFQNCTNLTSIELPQNITAIGNGAFQNTRISQVVIPAAVTVVEQNAFANTPMQFVRFEDNSQITTYIAASFALSQLKEIDFGNNSQLQLIQPSSFVNATQLMVVDFGDNAKLTEIGYAAFSGCSNLSAITLPNSLITIGGNAFLNCTKLISVSIPSAVTSIGWQAFSNTVVSLFLDSSAIVGSLTGNSSAGNLLSVLARNETLYIKGTISNITSFVQNNFNLVTTDVAGYYKYVRK